MTRARDTGSRAGRAALILTAVAVASAFAACTLNPQPLPPGDDSQATGDVDASTRADSGGFTNPETPPQTASDAGASADHEAGADDAGDASDGSDAGDAADGG